MYTNSRLACKTTFTSSITLIIVFSPLLSFHALFPLRSELYVIIIIIMIIIIIIIIIIINWSPISRDRVQAY